MTVENVTYIDDLDPAYPDGSDVIAEGDDHIRNIKKSIKATFPMVSSEVPLSVKGDGVTGFESSTEFGAGPDSNHNFIGDVFVGYDSPIAQPDEANGTLLCARGVLVGRGGVPGSASIGMEGNIIWGLGDPTSDDCAVSLGFVKQFFEGVEIDTNVSDGSEDGETISWNAAAEMWMKNDLLKVQTADGEVVVDNMLVTQSVDPVTNTSVEGHHGMVYKSELYNNANDPWSGVNGLDWEVGFVRPRDDGSNPNRKNGFDVVSDRFTVRLARDYNENNWWESQIVFRADGEDVEIGARNNTSSVYTNGDVYVGHQPGNRPDNNDVADGTLFVKQGIIVGRGNVGNASIGMEGNKITNLGDPTEDDHAISRGWLENKSTMRGEVDDIYAEQVRQAVVIANHENRVDDLEAFEAAQLESNQNVYEELVTHSLQIEALQNKPFEILEASTNFEEFKVAMIDFLKQAIKDQKPMKGIK